MTRLTYQLRERIGRGATAEVFAGVGIGELGFEKQVAIKRLLETHGDDESSMKEFVAEAQLVSQLNHPGVVEVIDFGVWDGLPFQVMELVEGLNLKEALARAPGGKAPLEVAIHIGHEVAVALDYVHHATNEDGKPLRIVHRDINPSNVMLSWTGHVKVMDFGIARAFRRRRYTEAGVVKGTVQYMAPEQLRAEPVTARTDLFALGCVLYELVVGASPLEKTLIREDIVAGRSIDLAMLPEAVRPIVDRATRVRATERYARGSEVAEACQSILQSLPVRDARRALSDWLMSLDEERATEPPEPYEIGLVPTFDGETRLFTEGEIPRASPKFPADEGAPELPTLHEGALEEETRVQRKLPPTRTTSDTIPTADGETSSVLAPITVPLGIGPTRVQTPTKSFPPPSRGPTTPTPVEQTAPPAWVAYLILGAIAVISAGLAYWFINLMG